jgi:maltooligosyltrehalose trehalohydrolase
MGDGKTLRLLANLSDAEISSELQPPKGVAIWGDDATGVVAPWSVHVHLGDQ